MKRHQIPALLALTGSIKYDGPLAYALARMRLRLGKHVDEIETRRKPENAYTQEVRDYLKAKNEIAMECAVRDERGFPKADQFGGIQIADFKVYDGAIKAFEEIKTKESEAFKIQDKALADWLNEEVAFAPWAGKREWLPKDGTAEEFEAILQLIAIPDEDAKPAK